MAAQATAFLEQANIVTALPRVVWDSSSILSDSSILGRAPHTLVGYSDRPTMMQLTVYSAVLGLSCCLCVHSRCHGASLSARKLQG